MSSVFLTRLVCSSLLALGASGLSDLVQMVVQLEFGEPENSLFFSCLEGVGSLTENPGVGGSSPPLSTQAASDP